MKFKPRLRAGLGALLSAAGFSSGAMAQNCPGVIRLPNPATTAISFGDALSFSLPILGVSVQSSPGQIRDCIVITTGAGGNFFNNNTPGLNNPYPNANGGPAFFATSQSNPGGGAIPGDSATTFDMTTAALKAYLGNNNMVMFFNHNQTNSGTAIDQNLMVWMQIRMFTPGGAQQFFYLTATSGLLPGNVPNPNFGQFGDTTSAFLGPQNLPNCTYPVTTDCVPPLFPTGAILNTGSAAGPPSTQSASFMVLARGQICLGAPGTPGSPIVPCDGCGGAVAATFNENLGADEVANAVVFPEINALLNAGTFTNISIDLRMGCNAAVRIPVGQGCPAGFEMNNGFEQLFIGRLSPTVCDPNVPPGCGIIPEPATLALFSLGLFAAAGVAGRTRRRKLS